MMRPQSPHILRHLLIVFGSLLVMGVQVELPATPKNPLIYVINNGDLRVMDVSTSTILFQVPNETQECPVSTSPNRQQALFSLGSSSPLRFAIINMNTGNQIPLPHTDIEVLGWSVNDVFYSHRPDREMSGTIYSFDTGTSQSQPIFSFIDLEWVSRGMWQHINGEFVFVSNTGDKLTLYRGTDALISYTLPGSRAGSISLSHDARFAAFHARDSIYEHFESYVLDLQTGAIQPIDAPRVRKWHPNSNVLAYTDGSADLAIYDAVIRTTQTLTELPREYGVNQIHWSPDGHYIAYQVAVPGGTKAPSRNIYLWDTASEAPILVSSYISEWAGQMEWVSPTQLIYNHATADYIQTDSGLVPANADLWLYDIMKSEKTRLTDTPDINEALNCLRG